MSQAPDSDDLRTVRLMPTGAGDERDEAAPGAHTLPAGTLIRDYEISSLIGEGGFGIVYLAYDHSLQRAVAMKEYMPSSMATRVHGSSDVRVQSQRHAETFSAGLKSFVNEARLLARFDHPALVKVYRFWEENGTAYMVMPYYEGPTLKSALGSRTAPPDEAQLRAWLQPLLDALGLMHAAHCFHRDIAPDNILLTPAGPLLLDFGAARRVIGDMTHDLTVVLKPGFAPIEQYGDVATMAQGPWTDLYALACVVHFAITGKVPMSSVERLMDDRLVPLSRIAAGRYSAGFLAAIDAALAVRPHDRPQSATQFAAMLEGTAQATTAAAKAVDSALPTPGLEMPVRPTPVPAMPVQPATTVRTAQADATRAGPKRRTLVIAGLGALLLVAGLGAALVGRPGPTAAPERPAAARDSGTALVTPLPSTPPQPVAVPDSAEAPQTPASSPAVVVGRLPAPPRVEPVTAKPDPALRREVPVRLPRTVSVAPDKPAHLETSPSAAARDKPTRSAGVQSRCSDILQKASLEPLTGEEAAYLKRECR